MKNKYFIILIFLIIIYTLSSQNLPVIYQQYNGLVGLQHNYETQLDTFQTSHITSDFGKRYIKENNVWKQKWHKGVDFNRGINDKGDHLLAISGGNIRQLFVSSNVDYKFIAIDGPNNLDFGYGHIFEDGIPQSGSVMQLGDLYLKQMYLPPDQFAIIYAPSNGDTIAIGPTTGYVIFNSDTLSVTDVVTDNQVIAPLGDSGGTNAHLHLYYYENINEPTLNTNDNCIDPLEVVSHAQPNYEITIDSVQTVYPGDSLSSVKVRCTMLNPDGSVPATANHYDNVTMNIDNVELFIKKEYEPDSYYNFIKGNSFESKIIHGARAGTTRYPSDGNPSWCSNTDIANTSQVGSFTKTGIKAYAYCDSLGYPYDDFYFSDIFLRIAEDDSISSTILDAAEINNEARYPDGKYLLKAKAVTVRDSVYWSEPQEITIDNFVPYIKEVKIYSNGSTAYWAGWHWWESTGLVYSEQVDSPIRAGNDITIKVTTSEPLDTLIC